MLYNYFMREMKVEVDTPFGTFKGSMSIEIEGEGLTGTFSVLGMDTEFEGSSEGSALSFSGNFSTPIGKLDYDASGEIDGDDIRGTVRTKIGNFVFRSVQR